MIRALFDFYDQAELGFKTAQNIISYETFISYCELTMASGQIAADRLGVDLEEAAVAGLSNQSELEENSPDPSPSAGSQN